MTFLPLAKMWERVELAREESDTALFLALLYTGETILKASTAGLVAAIQDDRDRHRYRQVHRLVRADGIGDWSSSLDDVISGTSAQHLSPLAVDERQELLRNAEPGTWQYGAVTLLHKCLTALNPQAEPLPHRFAGRLWFQLLATIRNKSPRGHGAPSTAVCSAICPDLESSLVLFSENFTLFKRPWAYLHRNLSGKYRVTRHTPDSDIFNPLKSTKTISIPDGVYIHLGSPALVELMDSDPDAMDFYFPNGNFRETGFELLSYITGNRGVGNPGPYLTPPTELPGSETQGVGLLEVQGTTFGNLPPRRNGYIIREALETELHTILTNDRHPVVTLLGRGGIGKTWLALSVLHQIAKEDRFFAIIWFSARDIDLLTEGPKPVRPHTLTERDIASELVRLLDPSTRKDNGFRATDFLADHLNTTPLGPILFVFDNFETVRNPTELFHWIDTYIRNPNKVLITTRHREFKGDYPVEVTGMIEQECDELVNSVATSLGIMNLLTTGYRQELYHESDGHPYIIKVLLGEVAKAGKLGRVDRIVADKDLVLDALFERTYSRLSPAAKRVFLTLCAWRSTVPELAVEAVLLRPSNDRMDVLGAIEDLSQCSFVEVSVSGEDGTSFITVPLVASIFGRRKLAVSPMKIAIEADTALLQIFGASQQSDVRHGVAPRIERMFGFIMSRVENDKARLSEYLPILEFVARKYPEAWLLLASLYEDGGSNEDLDLAKESVSHFLEVAEDGISKEQAWKRLARLYFRTGDWLGEVHAWVEMCQSSGVAFSAISEAANRVNLVLRERKLALDSEEKQIIVRKLISVMSSRTNEADATSCSRLAWLCLNSGDDNGARKYTELGLVRDPDNDYCRSLASKLGMWNY